MRYQLRANLILLAQPAQLNLRSKPTKGGIQPGWFRDEKFNWILMQIITLIIQWTKVFNISPIKQIKPI